jgi:proteasome assembly chaperone (PAC2) family protein
MEHLRWSSRPALRRPVVIAAFEGWNDAGDAASLAARWLRTNWAPREFAELDAEEFFDFTVTRPHVRLEDGRRVVDWPTTEATAGRAGPHDIVVLIGTEPQLKWRTFCDAIVQLASEVDAGFVLTLGALLAEVPHTRPTSVMATSEDPELTARFGLGQSSYEGPTGIVGVLHQVCARAGLSSMSIWAAVPAYVPAAPSPKGALALVRHLASLLDVSITPTDLEIAAASYERQVTEVVVDDEEMTDYVSRLETRYDDEDGVPSPASLVEEVERFLRDQRPN